MSKSRMRLLFVFVAILALVIAACTPAEEATEEPTEEPTAVVTEEVVEEEADAEAADADVADEEATEEAMDEDMSDDADMEATEEAMDEESDMSDDSEEMADDEEMSDDMEVGTIVDVAAGNEDFSTLVAAVQAAGLVDALSAEDADLTVFAPTNEAFEIALEALGLTAEELLADTELLTSVLLYHVAPGAVPAEVVVTLDGVEAPTLLEGATIAISIVDDGVVLNDSVNVVATDVMASNGIIHVIDAVLLPPAGDDMDMDEESDMSDDSEEMADDEEMSDDGDMAMDDDSEMSDDMDMDEEHSDMDGMHMDMGAVTAVYMIITNDTDEDVTLVGATTPISMNTEIHETSVVDDVAQMREIGEITIPAGESATLEPGGLHVMILDVEQDVMAGDSVDVELTFSNDAVFSLSAIAGDMLSEDAAEAVEIDGITISDVWIRPVSTMMMDDMDMDEESDMDMDEESDMSDDSEEMADDEEMSDDEDMSDGDDMMMDDMGPSVMVAPGDTVVLGFSAALTGEGVSAFGIDINRGVELALVDRPTVTVGDVEFEVVVDAQDSLCSAEGGQTVANRFASDDSIVGVIGPMCSSACTAAAPIFDEAGFTTISASCTAATLTTSGFASFNRSVPSDAAQGSIAAEYIYSTLGFTSIAVIDDGSAYGEGLANLLIEGFEELGGSIVTRDAVTVGDTDFRALLENIASNEPELIYFAGFNAEAARLIEQRFDVGLEEVPFMGADGMFGPELIELAGEASEGVYASAPVPASSEELTEFRERYIEVYGEEPPSAFNTNSYDATNILLNGIEAVGYIDDAGDLVVERAALSEYVRSATLSGLTGELVCDGTGECSTADVAFYQVVDGAYTLLGDE